MLRFLFVFFVTLVIGYFSILLSMFASGFLFFGTRAILPVPERLPYIVSTLVSWMIALLPGFWFVLRQARKGPAAIVWIAGGLALGISQVLFWGIMNFRMIG